MVRCSIKVKAGKLPMDCYIPTPDGGSIETRKGFFGCIEAWITGSEGKTYRVFRPDELIEILD